MIRRDAFHHQFAADVPVQVAGLMGATQRPVTEAALTEPLPTETPAWRARPTWFVYGDEDLNIPAELQRFQTARAGARVVRELPGASHAISVSQPVEVAEVILEAVATVRAADRGAAVA
ncbi:alpha/beta fold hydrolase [Homoserinibacter gongjuensis]|uniref:AB hydrolase-1 domain-containing protein n=1 Tax=Homoserinibacter gongjuensis TaxID=1162968 RepID=A0ABQ6JST7_9MICO|nr:alpha/beta hydrolase [Homoserinibacter gongjuensis]GMA89736.1 hypothetical protein GCM10025869_02650 [Homoserinibacter gongjuensis]